MLHSCWIDPHGWSLLVDVVGQTIRSVNTVPYARPSVVRTKRNETKDVQLLRLENCETTFKAKSEDLFSEEISTLVELRQPNPTRATEFAVESSFFNSYLAGYIHLQACCFLKHCY